MTETTITKEQLDELWNSLEKGTEMTDTFIYNLSSDKNGRECILLTFTYEDGVMNEELALHSYSSCANFNTSGVFTSENMFKLAKKTSRV